VSPPIQRSAWKWNSANFAFWGFSEVPHSPSPTPLTVPVGDRVPSGIIATSLWVPHLTLIRMFLRFVTYAAKFIADSSLPVRLGP
jgi:hypothetical protein